MPVWPVEDRDLQLLFNGSSAWSQLTERQPPERLVRALPDATTDVRAGSGFSPHIPYIHGSRVLL